MYRASTRSSERRQVGKHARLVYPVSEKDMRIYLMSQMACVLLVVHSVKFKLDCMLITSVSQIHPSLCKEATSQRVEHIYSKSQNERYCLPESQIEQLYKRVVDRSIRGLA